MVKTRRRSQRSNAKLIVLDKHFLLNSPKKLVTQMRLAKIEQLQSQIAYSQHQLDKLWNEVRHDLLAGALLEPGPFRAWFKQTMVLSGNSKKPAKIRTKMMVR